MHPLSPLVRYGSTVGVSVLVLAGDIAGGAVQRGSFAYLHLAVLVSITLLALGGVVAWWVTTWRIDGQHLQIRSGLIRRQSLRIPLVRIQAVDVIAPFLARVLGLAEVRVVLAGRGEERGRLAYLTRPNAVMMRAQLLALAHGFTAETPEPPSRPVLAVNNARLTLAILLSAPTVMSASLLVALVATAAGPARATVALGPEATVLFALVTGLWTRFLRDFNFVISEAGDGLRIQRGALQLHAETIPYGRIQAVRWVEPLLWRPLGWCRLEVDVARQRGPHGSKEEGQLQSRMLLPYGSSEQAAWLLSRTLPGASPLAPVGSGPPRRARYRAPFSYHYLRFWDDGGRYVAARTGRIRPATVIVPFEKVQSLRLVSGPVQRALRLANLHVDTAGRRWQARAECRDAAEADALIMRLSVLAREARRMSGAPMAG